MYAGSTLTPLSGRLVGAHQKLDRLARRALHELIKKPGVFPGIKTILHFEGVGGPDAIKRKSPAIDEPWHYFNPFDEGDQHLLDLIMGHHQQLVKALRAKDEVRAGFEAAWLAHAIVDGLTPAHHYPYEKELTALRGGESVHARTTYKEKLLMPGETRRKQMHNNWKMWGSKGLLSTHFLFEWGVATVLAPLRMRKFQLKKTEVNSMLHSDLREWFLQKAREVAGLGMYDAYYRQGWTVHLARQVRNQLAPILVESVTLAWYRAAVEAEVVKPTR